jgi:homoserine kinase
MKVVVPASTANLGVGFDSLGLALTKYLTVEVVGLSDKWEVEHNLGDEIPADETNYLVQILTKVAPDLCPYKLKMESDIPLARGLGSSSSVIVAGIVLANELADLGLSRFQVFELATRFEGHPDNVAPCIFGNFCVCARDGEHAVCENISFPKCDLVLAIPEYELLTEETRKVMPATLDFKEAVAASSLANVMVAFLAKNELKYACRLMMRDKLHEPYRAPLIREFETIKETALKNKAYACVISGAGPTILNITKIGRGEELVQKLDELNLPVKVESVRVAKEGFQLFR